MAAPVKLSLADLVSRLVVDVLLEVSPAAAVIAVVDIAKQ
jgi:hypothetical protein